MKYLIAIIGLIFIYMFLCHTESFIGDLTIVDPTSLYLHDDISEKEDWWRITHHRQPIYF